MEPEIIDRQVIYEAGVVAKQGLEPERPGWFRAALAVFVALRERYGTAAPFGAGCPDVRSRVGGAP